MEKPEPLESGERPRGREWRSVEFAVSVVASSAIAAIAGSFSLLRELLGTSIAFALIGAVLVTLIVLLVVRMRARIGGPIAMHADFEGPAFTVEVRKDHEHAGERIEEISAEIDALRAEQQRLEDGGARRSPEGPGGDGGAAPR